MALFYFSFLKMLTFYIFGNPLLPFDNLPIKFAPKLQKTFPKINFLIFDPNENLKPQNKKLFIIDTVEGTKDVLVLTNPEKIVAERGFSLHDFDLGFNLKLLQKIGELKEIFLIGLPMKTKNEKDIFQKTATAVRLVLGEKG